MRLALSFVTTLIGLAPDWPEQTDQKQQRGVGGLGRSDLKVRIEDGLAVPHAVDEPSERNSRDEAASIRRQGVDAHRWGVTRTSPLTISGAATVATHGAATYG
jgi:hypothetical protein